MRAKFMALLGIAFLLSLVSCSFGKGDKVVLSTPTPEEQQEQLIRDLKGPDSSVSFDSSLLFYKMRGDEAAALPQKVSAGVGRELMVVYYTAGTSTAATNGAGQNDAEPEVFQQELILGVSCKGEMAIPDPSRLVEPAFVTEGSNYQYVVFTVSDGEPIPPSATKRQDKALGFSVASSGSSPVPYASAFGGGKCWESGAYGKLKVLDALVVVNDILNDPDNDPKNENIAANYVVGHVSNVDRLSGNVFLASFPARVMPGSLVFALQSGYPEVVGMVTNYWPDSNFVMITGIDAIFPPSSSP